MAEESRIEEESQILKIIRDPLCPKIFISMLSFIQILILGFGYGDVSFSISINMLNFLTTLGVVGIMASKKTEQMANFCLFRFSSGTQETLWNELYHAYAIVFGSLNFLTIAGNLIYYGHNEILSVFGFVITSIYYIDAYRSYEKINTIPIDESTPRRCSAGTILKFIGRYPKIMRLIVIAFAIAYFVVANRLFFGYSHRYYGYYDRAYRGRSADMTYIIVVIVILISIVDVLVMHVKSIRKRVEKVFGENFVHYGMRFTLTLAMTTFSFVGFMIDLIDGVRYQTYITIFMFVVFVLNLLMTIAEKYIKSIASGQLPTVRTSKSILPKNLAKNILNPITSDIIKSHVQDTTPEIIGYDERPLLK